MRSLLSVKSNLQNYLTYSLSHYLTYKPGQFSVHHDQQLAANEVQNKLVAIDPSRADVRLTRTASRWEGRCRTTLTFF